MAKFPDVVVKQDDATRFTLLGTKLLVGKRITQVSYMTPEDAAEMGWQRGVVLTLDDTTQVIVQRDDEGNDAGALLIAPPTGNAQLLPVLR